MPSPMARPSCQEISPPRTTPITWRPISFSRMGRHGTRLKPSPSSIIAEAAAGELRRTEKLAPDRLTLVDGLERETAFGGELPSDAFDLLSRQRGDEVSLHPQPALRSPARVTPQDQFLRTPLERLARLGAEPAGGQ